jgi:serine phosphatase RsbU (regulator of sigma subunit)
VSRALLAELIDAIGAEHATTWQVSADGHWLELLGMRGFTVEQMVGHERVSLEAPRPVADAVRTRAVRCFGTAADVDAAFPALGGVFARRGLESVLVVPLLSAGRAVGGLLACASRPHAFGRDERALATALAAQAGQALDRARLFDAERHVSVTLQRALLPRALPDVEGVELAVRYLPAAGLEAGGDFYEVLPLPDGTLWVAVGDVVGRGAAAAAAMGQLRSALRAFALLGAGPGQVLEQLSAFADTVDGAMAATAVAARLTPATGELRYACAGHPWPLLVDAGRAEFLCEGRGVPLGCMPDPTYREAAVRLSPGATLLLYTDGLTERRGIEVAAVLERMRAAAETTAGEPVRHLLDATVTASGGDAPADDVALVALRLAGIRPRPG